MKRITLMVAGGLIVVFGIIFVFQGSGAMKGSAMSNNHFWVYGGVVVAIVGLALLLVGVRSRRPN